MNWGSVADWVSGLGTIGAVLIALRKPRDQFLLTITDENKLKIENIAPVNSRIIIKSNKYSDTLNGSFILAKAGEEKDHCEIALPSEYTQKIRMRLKIYSQNTGITTRVKIIINPIKSENEIQTVRAALYRKELGMYRKEYGTKLKISYKILPIDEKPHKINELEK